MANFNVTYVGALGVQVVGVDIPRIVVASVGGSLLQYLLENAGTPPGTEDPLPDGFHAVRIAHFEAIVPDDYGTASVDWTSFQDNIDPDAEYAIQIEGPGFTAADPSPSLTAWAIALGGTVQGTQANP